MIWALGHGDILLKIALEDGWSDNKHVFTNLVNDKNVCLGLGLEPQIAENWYFTNYLTKWFSHFFM